ncbi:CPBP family intramembrane glutamic endopeptidase [Pseudonocardia sp. HH130629-09]|uniref:CPBP family intramembrane glutamic endopeptidase n=1 Tax=Pseudonocardia sp. HH130629-09 TaxID=1641402 RepID=UPI000AB50B02|nr:type II CAAX endopeptidase family protein [Pseudonocardia sp. HH130629-09]
MSSSPGSPRGSRGASADDPDGSSPSGAAAPSPAGSSPAGSSSPAGPPPTGWPGGPGPNGAGGPGPYGPGGSTPYGPGVPAPWGPGGPEQHGPGTPYGPPPRRGLFGIEPSPPPPRPFRGLLAFLVVEIVFLGSSFLLAVGLGEVDSAQEVLLAIVVPTILAALTCVVWTRVFGSGPVSDLGLQFRWEDVGIGLLIGVAGLFVTIPAALAYLYLVGPDLTTSVGVAFEGIRTTWPVALAVMVGVVVIAPVCEEIVYRGLLWNAVAHWIGNRWVVFVLTTAVFALAHLEFLRAPLLFVVALPLGIARLLTGRVTAGIVAHAVNNFLPGLALALMLVGAFPAV